MSVYFLLFKTKGQKKCIGTGLVPSAVSETVTIPDRSFNIAFYKTNQ